MSLNGTVWAPIGPSPMNEPRRGQRTCHRYRGQSQQPERVVSRLRTGRRLAQRRRGQHVDPDFRPSELARYRRTRRHRNRPRQYRYHLCRHQLTRRQRRARHYRSAHRRPVQVHSTAAPAGSLSVQATQPETRATPPGLLIKRSTSSSSIPPAASSISGRLAECSLPLTPA